jgi:DNA (cytosine-5)-methyltransferase 1
LGAEVDGRAYYNEVDPYAAQWLRNLIAAGHIAPGDVDERSIVDVRAGDLAGYTQHHLFAGIGGWSLALRLAGWPDERPVWTGSCPCQPFSTAGKRKGFDDDRHLWPVWRDLIRDYNQRQQRIAILFGEQVARRAGYEWMSGVRTDLEDDSYAVGAANLCAAGVGKWHRRQRLYWVAIADHKIRRQVHGGVVSGESPCESATSDGALWQGNGSTRDGGSAAPSSTVAWLRQWESIHGVRCLDDGLPGDVAIHGAIGNAIVPELAAAFIQAASEAIG